MSELGKAMSPNHKTLALTHTMNKKFYVYYGSEENGYEEDFLGTFPTIEDAKRCIAENLEDDFSTEEEVAKAISEIDDNGYEGVNEHEYHILYLIGEHDYECLQVLYGLQEDFGEEFED